MTQTGDAMSRCFDAQEADAIGKLNSDLVRVVVAVPTLNEAGSLKGVISALVRDQTELVNLNIVIADGGSTDGTVDIAKELANDNSCVHYIHNPKRIQAAAINLVAREWAGRADVIVRCDAHAGYPRRFVSSLIEAIEQHAVQSVVVPMDSHGHGCVGKSVAWVSDTVLGSGGSSHRGGRRSGFVDHGHHAAFVLKDFLDNGGYDETFSHNEDAELDCRLTAGGCRIYLDSSIRVQYYPRESLSSLWKQYFNYGRGRSRTIRKHPKSIGIRQFLVPAHAFIFFASILLYLIIGNLLFLAWPILYLSILMAFSIYIAVSKRDWCGLLAGVSAATMHTAWASGFIWGLLTQPEVRWVPAGRSS
ncbi:MAG: glycosyltransferase family 2 protein [Pseudomonadota bacterium]